MNISNDVTVIKKAQEIIDDEMKSVGITDKKPFEVLAKLLTARKMTVDKFGDEHWEDDNGAQGKAVELTLRLKRLLDNKLADLEPVKHEHRLAPGDIERLESISRELISLETRLNSDKAQRGKVIEVLATIPMGAS